MSGLKTLFFSIFVLVGQVIFAQSEAKITKGEFYGKGMKGLEVVQNFKSGDSTFILELSLFRPDSFHTVSVAWYIEGFEGSNSKKIDSAVFGIKRIEDKFTVSLTRSSFAWPVGFYYAKVFLDGVFQETYFFKVLSEPVLSANFFTVKGNELTTVNKWTPNDSNVFLRVYLDRQEVKDSSKLEAAWFFELPGDEPLFLDETKYVLAGDYNYIDFSLKGTSEWPLGFIAVEIWLDGQFKKFFRIEVK